MKLNEKEIRLVGKLLRGIVGEFYPTRWYDWDEVAALRDRLAAEGIDFSDVGTGFDEEFPLEAR